MALTAVRGLNVHGVLTPDLLSFVKVALKSLTPCSSMGMEVMIGRSNSSLDAPPLPSADSSEDWTGNLGGLLDSALK